MRATASHSSFLLVFAGFVTTGLELWASKPCAAKHFRQRLWGTLNMPQAILSDARCWVAHMGLNQVGVVYRASQCLCDLCATLTS